MRCNIVDAAIAVKDLSKTYKTQSDRKRQVGELRAVDVITFEVARGEFFGLLGPNGAGKTTTIGVLTTRVRPTGGSAAVAGIDVGADPVGVRQRIGVAPPRPNPARQLTAIQTLRFHAAYFGIPRAVSLPRAQALLEELGLGERGESKVD